MLLYKEGVWVPYPEATEMEICVRDHRGNPLIEMAEPVIVCSVKDLQDLWHAAQDRAVALHKGHPRDTKIFEEYLESKNIQIP